MDIERIEQVKLLKSLKSTDEKGKPIVWLAGTVFKMDKKKPLPQSILRELTAKRRGGSIVEITFKPEPLPLVPEPDPEPEPEKEKQEETPDIIPDDKPEVAPKKAPVKRTAVRRSTTKKK